MGQDVTGGEEDPRLATESEFGETGAQKREKEIVDDRRSALNERYLYWKSQLSATKSDPAIMVVAELLMEAKDFAQSK